MQNFIYFLVIFPLSLATDVYVFAHRGQVFKSTAPWKFRFTWSDQLYMAISYRTSPSFTVTAATVTYESDLEMVRSPTVTLSTGTKVPVYVRQFRGPAAIINLNVYTSNGLCRSIRVAEGRVVSKKPEKEYKYTDICFKEITKPCFLTVDLKDFICEDPLIATRQNETLKTTTPLSDLDNNNTAFVSNLSSATQENKKTSTNSSASNTESNDQQPLSLKVVLIYVIPFVIGICVIMVLVIYLSVKQYCLRNSHPVQTMELNTYATANEVVYADLSLMHSADRQQPRLDEESPYAEIIGELHPH